MKVELLPTRDCEAGYSPENNTDLAEVGPMQVAQHQRENQICGHFLLYTIKGMRAVVASCPLLQPAPVFPTILLTQAQLSKQTDRYRSQLVKRN